MTAIARWKDLCIDANDAKKLGRFWAAGLGLEGEDFDDDPDFGLIGPTKEHRIWINTVPEPVTVKQRVHLDLNAGSVEEYELLGATRVTEPGQFPWTVMRDPEGGEFCVFVRSEVPEQRLYEIGIDSTDPSRIARWWAEAFGGAVIDDPHGFSSVEQIPGAPFQSMDFVPVPEPKSVKNRIHWDVLGSVSELERAGAVVLRPQDDQIRWTVMADPEGNEFCAFEQ